ncbi:hypothetical protein ACFY30_18965 [Streptomyces sp. NPDC000345]|uniref:hypothetical protein n=1 Tax=Streptomyces sp. NPDC000345 TaxID=3364537 RepID=UPI003688CB26
MSRTAASLNSRSASAVHPGGRRTPGTGGRYHVESCLGHHAAEWVHRIDAGSYVVLSEAMNSHDIGRGRGGVRATLRRVTARTLMAGVGVGPDRLCPPSQRAEPVAGIATAADLRVIEPAYGHDGS